MSEEEVSGAIPEPAEESELPVVPMDCDPSDWTLAEQMAYRAEVGVNPQYAMLMIGKAFEAEDAEKYTNIDPSWLLGIAWITARRKDKFVKLAAMAEAMEYSELLRSVIKWAEARAPEPDPTPAPKRAARKPK